MALRWLSNRRQWSPGSSGCDLYSDFTGNSKSSSNSSNDGDNNDNDNLIITGIVIVVLLLLYTTNNDYGNGNEEVNRALMRIIME